MVVLRCCAIIIEVHGCKVYLLNTNILAKSLGFDDGNVIGVYVAFGLLCYLSGFFSGRGV